MKKILVLSDESQTILLGSTIAKNCTIGCIIYLMGSIGSGKTIFCKGFLQKFGYMQYVKSPTYTLIEPYFLSDIYIYHCDFYRLNSEEELIYTGISDYFNRKSFFLIEWPKKSIKILPDPDIIITINYYNCSKNFRQVIIETFSIIGKKIINCCYDI